MKELKHLSEVYKNYDTFVIDLWGVIHNGVVLNSKAVEAVDQLKNNSKKVVFLSNAPRPSSKVINFLLKMNLDKKYLSYDNKLKEIEAYWNNECAEHPSNNHCKIFCD